MLRHCRCVARLHWWVAYPQSLVRTSMGPSRESAWNRLPERRTRWLRVVGGGLGALVRVAGFALGVVRFLATVSSVNLFAWVMVIAYLDRDLVRRLAPDMLLGTIQTHWAALPGTITVASAALAVALAFRRPRVRALAAHRLASEQACLGALSRMLGSLGQATFEMWKIGSGSVADLRYELVRLVERVSHGTCRINEKLAVEFVRGPRLTMPHASTLLRHDTERLSKAVRAIERERTRLDRQGELPTLSRLLGRAGHMRDEALALPSVLQSTVTRVSSEAVRELIEREAGLFAAGAAFDDAEQSTDARTRQRLEVRGAMELQLSLRRIDSEHRREMATLAREVAESKELCFRLRRRLRPRFVDRFLAR